jgi:cyclophilin family peptidyl-prolyl cis-trans isomerase
VGTNADKHARQSANRNRIDEARRQMEARARRRRMMTIIGGLIAVAVVIFGVVALTGDDDEVAGDDPTTGEDQATTTTVDDDAAPDDPTQVELPDPPAGATLTEPTECPPEDRAEERVQVFASEPPECIDTSATYTATFSTSHGEFTATLDAQTAPTTVNNFVVLSRYRYYDGVPFHRIVPGFVVQAGDGDGAPWGNNDLGYSIADELPADSSAYNDYALAMANAGPDTNGSQFFVVLPGGGSQLQPLYSRFGEVTEGQDVIDRIGQLGQAQQPTEVVLIESVTIEQA